MKPVVDRLRRRYEGRIDFMVYADMNTDPDASDYARQQGVEYVPTSVLVSPTGEELERWVGAQPEGTVSAAFDSALAGASP